MIRLQAHRTRHGAAGAMAIAAIVCATVLGCSAIKAETAASAAAPRLTSAKIPVTVAAGKTVTFVDVLGSVFGQSSAYGALQIYAAYTSATAGGSSLVFLAETSTPGFGGTFGQSVPAATAADLIRNGTDRSILAVREDGSFRTNLILANATEAALTVDVKLVGGDGTTLGTKSYPLQPLGMIQVSKVVRDLGVSTDLSGARLVLSTPTVPGTFAAYATVIDNVTNDPRTLLPR